MRLFFIFRATKKDRMNNKKTIGKRNVKQETNRHYHDEIFHDKTLKFLKSGTF